MTDLLHSLRALLRHCRALDRPVIEEAIAEIEDHKMHIEIWRGMYNVMASQRDAAYAEIAALRHDVERHVAICAELATAAERRE